MTSRMSSLTQLHQRIDDQLCREMRRPSPNNLVMSQLKREKLRIKDLIYRAARQRHARLQSA